MKQFVLLSVVLSVVVAAPAPSVDVDLSGPQVQCIFKLVKNTVQENNGLKNWHNEFEQAFITFAQNLLECQMLEETKQHDCYENLKKQTHDEYNRLVKMLPEKIRVPFTQSFTKCLMKPSEVFVSGFNSNSAVKLNYPISPDEFNCGKNVVLKFVENHPEYNQWSEDVKTVSYNFRNQNKKCESIHQQNIKKQCYNELNATADSEYNRLVNLLAEEVRGEFVEDFNKCFDLDYE